MIGATATVQTGSYAVYSLLKLQVMAFFNGAIGTNSTMISTALDKQYVSYIEAQGMRGNKIHAALRVEIDWRVLGIAVKAGGELINVPGHWKNNIDPDISEAVRVYNDYCNKFGLARAWEWNHTNTCTIDDLIRDLNISGYRTEQREYSEGLIDVRLKNTVIPGLGHTIRLDKYLK